jgi:hypothetical protein
LMRNSDLPLAERFAAAQAALPLVHPKLTSGHRTQNSLDAYGVMNEASHDRRRDKGGHPAHAHDAKRLRPTVGVAIESRLRYFQFSDTRRAVACAHLREILSGSGSITNLEVPDLERYQAYSGHR